MSKLEDVAGNFLSLLSYMRRNYFRHAEQIARLRLSPGQFHALSILSRQGPLSMMELAGEMRISKQQLTPLIGKLIDAGLVFRKRDEQDRRVVRIELTDDGVRTFTELRAEIKSAFTAKLGVLSEEELTELDHMLRHIQAILEGSQSETPS